MAGHDNWLTPPDLFAVLDSEFVFDLDSAASDGHEKIARHITPEQDALATDWRGKAVWCNPPYSMMREFVCRAWQQCQAQRNVIVLLIPAYTDPGYWWDCIVPFADEIRFLRGRVSFLENSLDGKRESARFPSVVIVFRHRRGVQKGAPRVFWWDWKPVTDAERLENLQRAPLFAESVAE